MPKIYNFNAEVAKRYGRKKTDGKTLLYKGKPLIRNGNTIYYGNTEDKMILKLRVLENRPVSETEDVATKVEVNLVSLENGEKVIKKGEKTECSTLLTSAASGLKEPLPKLKKHKNKSVEEKIFSRFFYAV